MRYTEAQRDKLIRTARINGAVGKNPVVYQWLVNNIDAQSKYKILDYGSGKHAQHTARLRSYGYDIYAHDLEAVDEHAHMFVRGTVGGDYNLVLLSNVVNVQPSPQHVHDLFRTVWYSLRPGGKVIFNLPRDPNHTGMTFKEIVATAHAFGYNVEPGDRVIIATRTH